ncbi:AMP-binding protein [bacterium]|nr:AMP-binding protein [bacterium]
MANVPWVSGLTIGQVLRETARRNARQDAVVFPQLDVRLNWQDFDALVDRAAKGLLALGFEPGDHFGVWATNWPEWLVLQFATARTGVVLVTINPAYRTSELQFALQQSEIRGLALIQRFKTSNYYQMLLDVCPELVSATAGHLCSDSLPNLEWVIQFHGAEHPGMLTWARLLKAGESVSDGELQSCERLLAASAPIALQYTSGTTGHPKGALLTHSNLLLNGYYTGDCQRLSAADRICIPVPLYHCFGCVLGTVCAVVYGAAMVFPGESYNPVATLRAIEAERCTAIYGVPTMFIAELESPEFPRRDTSSLRTGIMAGSPCPIELMKRVTADLGARDITIGYGQTEASPIITMTRTDDPIEARVGSVGRVIPGVEVKIVDPETGAELPDNQSGELCCRGHNVMLGYYNMPDRTAEAIDADGWLHTGDIALRQPDGYYRITGRQKDMIIRGGENISPREIEELLYQLPQIEDVQIVGVPDRKFGEEILACVKLRSGQTVSETEIRKFCHERLAHYKTPRYVKFVDQFPTTVTGKIQKFRLREQAIEELGLSEVASLVTA